MLVYPDLQLPLAALVMSVGGGVWLLGGITFMDSKGTSLGTLTYASRGVEKRKFGNFDIEWHQFEATSGASDKVKMYKYLVMLAVHSDTPEGVKHWHMRYGSESFKELIDEGCRLVIFSHNLSMTLAMSYLPSSLAILE